MRSFLASFTVAIIVAVGAMYLFEEVWQRRAEQAFTSPTSVQIPDHGTTHNLVGKEWNLSKDTGTVRVFARFQWRTPSIQEAQFPVLTPMNRQAALHDLRRSWDGAAEGFIMTAVPFTASSATRSLPGSMALRSVARAARGSKSSLDLGQ
jgi:hypothetical protein